MGSLVKSWAEQIATDAVRDYFASDEFKAMLKRQVRWASQGFEPGFRFMDREAFTQTVADRIHQVARVPVYVWGYRIWRKRMPMAECFDAADGIVTDFLHGSRIKFGDPDFDWRDGADLADEDMAYWEAA